MFIMRIAGPIGRLLWLAPNLLAQRLRDVPQRKPRVPGTISLTEEMRHANFGPLYSVQNEILVLSTDRALAEQWNAPLI